METRGCRSIRCRPHYRPNALENEQANSAILHVFLSRSAAAESGIWRAASQRELQNRRSELEREIKLAVLWGMFSVLCQGLV